MIPSPRILILSTVWPEPQSSAAGVRQMQWIHFFLRQNAEVYLSSPSKLKAEADWGALELPPRVHLLPLPLNQSSVKDDLKRLNPDIVMFDRFILEEQFGHFIYETCPDALVLLETQDLHFIRRARDALKEKILTLDELPARFFQTETALRETASILRVDYSFVISSFEEKLLLDEFSIGSDRVKWIPFFYSKDPSSEEKDELNLGFEERRGFSWVGNFRHPPNPDGLRWLRAEIWPLIRKKLPGARLKIYGAYPTEEVMQWNKPEQGIEVKGSVDDLDSVFSSARVNIAPLRFGAGIKGKIIEGFRRGVPCVSTKIGLEGIAAVGENHFGAVEANTPEAFADACVRLHEQKEWWEENRLAGKKLVTRLHSTAAQEPILRQLIQSLHEKKRAQLLPNWEARILRHELVNSHKYFSKWIEEKEKSILEKKDRTNK